jgi:hypothetical protein
MRRRTRFVALGGTHGEVPLPARSGEDNGARTTPVRSGKQGCEDQAVIDLLLAKPRADLSPPPSERSSRVRRGTDIVAS